MPKVKVYNLNGEVVREEELAPQVFDIVIKPVVVQQVVEAQLANSRQVLAHTKGRGEVRGGGKKPWNQKGTGRARHSSIRSPLWVGGGVTFGPTKLRNFSKSVNKKMKKKALAMVLTDKVKHDNLVLLEELTIAEPKTKLLVNLLGKLPVKDRKTLIILDKKNDNLIKGSQNLHYVSTEPAQSLNVVDLLNADYLLLTVKAAKKISANYLAD
ncbi:MAG: 50S ribosomal protein L4 [Parcubacteria group bacterium GW2011_GWA2_43_17]|nr:MAG: 50S ribosomal protein L4 [Parcubacteria group bacterium GW2011_GWA2_43_17]KKT92742.1 MAG: 50S ribosomal protein L4 [Parcubacteria group bacterium GW2011_GWF2_45_11]OGY93335.1 MAG: 50S ribosomal protein L4 [Candidatus Komeilibacteria bacterium RIFOXYC2_FULL_45_12]OGY94933.1 MAG: 50S ribosomal protein L4 [Candidatus Komeilibacteria bacterium RIFOXYA2_FULL_45_9]HAH03961.1 50S ribosomal protein L4 [Candidatus Komeilibacteria bacterium]